MHSWCAALTGQPLPPQAPPTTAKRTPLLRLVAQPPTIISTVPRTREEWLAWRQKGIGGSDAPAIMHSSPFATAFDIWARKTGRMAGPTMTWPMRRGVELEPEARALYEEQSGIEMPKRCLHRTDITFARGSYDGLNENDGRRGIEIKAPKRADHELALAGGVPAYYYWQCIHLYLVGDLESLEYVSYHPKFPPGKRLARVPVKRDLEAEKTLLKAETEFWACVINDVPPPDPRRNSAPGDIFKVRRNRHG